MTRLLVSVRSAAEAEAALRGGASLIDVKDPTNGSLGRASADTIADVVRVVGGRTPVSAALGELSFTWRDMLPPAGVSLAYVKWGLSAYRGAEEAWAPELLDTMRRLAEHRPGCRAVAVAYADWRRAGAPVPEQVCDFAVAHSTGAFLLDTWGKDGSTLLDWVTLTEIERLAERCRAAGMPVALAGSLGPDEMRTLLPLRPDWIAVRGAACSGRRRQAAIDENKVRQLVEILTPAMSAD